MYLSGVWCKEKLWLGLRENIARNLKLVLLRSTALGLCHYLCHVMSFYIGSCRVLCCGIVNDMTAFWLYWPVTFQALTNIGLPSIPIPASICQCTDNGLTRDKICWMENISDQWSFLQSLITQCFPSNLFCLVLIHCQCTITVPFCCWLTWVLMFSCLDVMFFTVSYLVVLSPFVYFIVSSFLVSLTGMLDSQPVTWQTILSKVQFSSVQ